MCFIFVKQFIMLSVVIPRCLIRSRDHDAVSKVKLGGRIEILTPQRALLSPPYAPARPLQSPAYEPPEQMYYNHKNIIGMMGLSEACLSRFIWSHCS